MHEMYFKFSDLKLILLIVGIIATMTVVWLTPVEVDDNEAE